MEEKSIIINSYYLLIPMKEESHQVAHLIEIPIMLVSFNCATRFILPFSG